MEKPSLGYYAGSRWFMTAVAAILISLFSLWLVAALLEAEEATEKMVVEGTLRNMRVGLRVAMGEALIAGRENEIAQWAGSDPVRWLGGPPSGYRGECPVAGIKSLPTASWCFDKAHGQLLYRPYHDRHLRLLEGVAGERKEKILRWQVVRPVVSATHAGFVGLTVQLLTPYVWLTE